MAKPEKPDPLISDERFSRANTRPQFLPPQRKRHRVKLDKRFSAVLSDDRFRANAAPRDKYGRKNEGASAREDLESFYEVESESEVEGESESDSKEDIPGRNDPDARLAYLTKLSRGESSSSSSSEEESEEEEEEDEAVIHSVLLPRKDVETGEQEASPFLAICELDWDRVRAVDVLSILTSFRPPGAVLSVRVYPSDFGLERMERDARSGPSDVFRGKPEEGLREESAFDAEKLRQYEVSKLKYYFAVAEFRSAREAEAAYEELDGLEFEHSSSTVDLRVIAGDAMEGVKAGRKVRDEAFSVPSNYEPVDYVVKALRGTGVNCSWEAADEERTKKLTRYGMGTKTWDAMLEGDDLKAYLASSDDSDGSDVDDKANGMRKMLGLEGDHLVHQNNHEEHDQDPSHTPVDHQDINEGKDKQVTYVHQDISHEAKDKQVTYVPGENSLDQKIRSKLSSKKEGDEPQLTPFEKSQQRRREKRKERKKAKRELRERAADPDQDDFFLSETDAVPRNDSNGDAENQPSSRAELELLLAGDENVENDKDYDMRSLLRIESKAGKKLKGKRKRDLERKIQETPGSGFQLDASDNRFDALFGGSDARFGIDVTDPKFKATEGMKNVLKTQKERREERSNAVVPENPKTSENDVERLVKSLKRRAKKKLGSRS